MQTQLKKTSGKAGFTLVEMVVCFAIITLVIGGMLTAYSNAAIFTERAGYQLAAQCLAVRQVEHVRAALWDTQSNPIIDNTTNLPSTTVALLELPVSGTNAIYATNQLTVTTITNTLFPPSYIKMIQVYTTWPWNGGVMSNVMITYRAPDE
jgi:Tfp pilus assembly protein PilE